MRKILASLAIFIIVSSVTNVQAQTKFATEHHFHELFVTAGYSTAFGAALGAAALGLTENPSDKLQYIATGASLGFIVGSMVGTYVIFTPVFTYGQSSPGVQPSYSDLADPGNKSIHIQPTWNLTRSSLQSLDLSWNLASF